LFRRIHRITNSAHRTRTSQRIPAKHNATTNRQFDFRGLVKRRTFA
jgi:hypothetical protein